MGTVEIGERYMAIKVEVDQKPLKEALEQLKRRGLLSAEEIDEGEELIDMELIRAPERAACRVVMKPGKKLRDLLEKDGGG